MAIQSIPLLAELDEFAAPFVDSGRYASTTEVLHAAMEALLREQAEQDVWTPELIALAEEGEASGDAEGDVIERLRAKFDLAVHAA